LYFKSYKERRTKVLDPHVNTFVWLWDHSKYTKWENGRNSCLLWVQGKPGSGKSTLANYVRARVCDFIDQRAQQSIVVDFFYSARGGNLQNGHYWMLRSILYQFLVKAPGLWVGYLNGFRECRQIVKSSERQDGSNATGLFADFSEPSSKYIWTLDRLKALFSSLGSAHEPGLQLIAYVIIDALDESEDYQRQEMIQIFCDIASRDPSWPITFKIFLTSRPSPKIERILQKRHTLVLEDETARDIANYVNSETRRISKEILQCEYEELDYISSYLIREAQGVFLWVRLVLIELDEGATEGFSSVAEHEALLISIPKDLKQLYLRILNKVQRGPTLTVQECQTVLRWIAYSPRPLLIDEMREVVAASACGSTGLSHAQLQRRRVGNTEILRRRLISLCGNLVEVKGGTAQFIHTTVREYLLEGNMSKTISLRPPDSLLEIGSLCVNYVESFQKNIRSVRPISGSEEWLSGDDIQLYIQQIDRFVLLHYIFGCEIDFLDALDEEVRKQRQSRTLTDAMASACTDLQPVVLESILQGNIHALRRLILYADQINALYLLPRHDPRLEYDPGQLTAFPEEEWRATLLQVISFLKTESKSAMLSLLLKSGADPNCRDNSGRTSLHTAVKTGARAHALLFKLVEDRTEPTIQDAFEARTPLLRFCHDLDVNLLKTGAKNIIHACTGIFIVVEYGDPLMTKLDRKSKKPLRSFLKPAITSGDKALWATVRILTSVHKKLCRILVDEDGLGDALRAHDPLTILEQFCEKVRDEALKMAVLSLASARAVISELLDSGADPTIKDNTGTVTPLDLALGSGDQVIAFLLLTSLKKKTEKDLALAKTKSEKYRVLEQTGRILAKYMYLESQRGSDSVSSWLNSHETR
jgi:hypothetical protein